MSDPYIDFINNLPIFKAQLNLDTVFSTNPLGIDFFKNIAKGIKMYFPQLGTEGLYLDYDEIGDPQYGFTADEITNYRAAMSGGFFTTGAASGGFPSNFAVAIANALRNGSPTPNNIDTLSSTFNTFMSQFSAQKGPIPDPAPPDYVPEFVRMFEIVNPNIFYETFQKEYFDAMGVTQNIYGLDVIDNGLKVINTFLSKYITQANFPAIAGGTPGTFQQTSFNMVQAWHKFITATSTLDSNVDAPDDQVEAKLTTLISYKEIYEGLAPEGSTQADFEAELIAFINRQITNNGFFLPSVFVGNWIQQLKSENSVLTPPLNANLNPANNYAITGSTLTGNSSEKVLVINRILKLILKMIQILQNVGIAQANHLTYTTNFQRAYTALQQQIPVFLKTGGSGIGSGTDDAGKARAELNSNFNAVLADNLRALRGLQEDSAKKQQSDINQTNDAANQQTDMATTFIQQLNTLLSSILR